MAVTVGTTGGPWAHLTIHGRPDSFSLPETIPCGDGRYTLTKIPGSADETIWRYRWES